MAPVLIARADFELGPDTSAAVILATPGRCAPPPAPGRLRATRRPRIAWRCWEIRGSQATRCSLPPKELLVDLGSHVEVAVKRRQGTLDFGDSALTVPGRSGLVIWWFPWLAGTGRGSSLDGVLVVAVGYRPRWVDQPRANGAFTPLVLEVLPRADAIRQLEEIDHMATLTPWTVASLGSRPRDPALHVDGAPREAVLNAPPSATAEDTATGARR